MKIISRVWTEKIKLALKDWPVVILYGPRFSGKSFILRKLLLPQLSDTAYITFDDWRELQEAKNQPDIFIESFLPKKILIIDEFQRVPEVLLPIKKIVDEKRGTKFILSGSVSQTIIKEKIESLVGRAFFIDITTLLPEEIGKKESLINWERIEKFFGQKDKQSELLKQSKKLFESYLLFGGYPWFWENEKRQVFTKRDNFFENLLRSFLEKEIIGIFRPESLFLFPKILRLLAERVGFPISFSSIASDLGINVKTVQKMIAFLENAFLVTLIFPKGHFGSFYKEKPKIYFNDLGLLSSLLRINDLKTITTSSLIENFVFLRLWQYSKKNNLHWQIFYLSDYQKREIDFVVETKRGILAIEVKWQQFKNIKRVNFEIFKKEKLGVKIVVNKDGFFKTKDKIFFLPPQFLIPHHEGCGPRGS